MNKVPINLTCSNLSKKLASVIDISSIINVLQRFHFCVVEGLEANLMHCSIEASPDPIPKK